MAAVISESEAQIPEVKPTVDRAAATRQKATRREADALWRPSHSTAYWIETLNLRTSHGRYVYNLGLVKAQQSFYFLFLTLPDDDAAIDAAEAEVMKHFNTVESGIRDELARVRAVNESIAARPADGYSATDEGPISVAMYTPEAARFAQMVLDYDTLVQEIEVMWFAGHINRKTKAALQTQHRNAIIRFSRSIFILSQRAKNAVRNHREARDAARAAKARPAQGRRRDGDVVTAPVATSSPEAVAA